MGGIYQSSKLPNSTPADSEPLGVLGEVAVVKVRLFVNAENLLDIRQTKYDRLILSVRVQMAGGW